MQDGMVSLHTRNLKYGKVWQLAGTRNGMPRASCICGSLGKGFSVWFQLLERIITMRLVP